MPIRTRVALVILWVASLVLVTVWASAQSQVPPPPRPQTPVVPYVLSGSDVGFKVDSVRGNIPRGQLVVRINGQWVPVDFGTGEFR